MELSPYVEGLRTDLGALTRFAPDEIAKLAEQLAEALDSSVRLTLLNVLTDAAAEITDRLDMTVVDVRLTSGEPEFVVTSAGHHEEAAAPAESSPDDAGTARMTLRLSEALKVRIEAQASASGLSVNSWLAHAAIRALEAPGPSGQQPKRNRSGPGQRITGFARS
jgi:hypothetical protein